MARLPREKVNPYEPGYYHAYNRSVFEINIFEKEKEKKIFFSILEVLLKAFFVTLLDIKLMKNHYHLVFKIQIPDSLEDEEIERRIKILHPKKKYDPAKKNKYKEKLGDISQFMKALQERFAMQYNNDHNRYGHVWAGRYESTILADEAAALNCLCYLELNGVNVGREVKPEDDPYSAIGMVVNRTMLERRAGKGKFILLPIDISEIIDLVTEVSIPDMEKDLEKRFGYKLNYLSQEEKKGFIKFMAFVRMKYLYGFQTAVSLFTKRGIIVGKKRSIKKLSRKLKYRKDGEFKFYPKESNEEDLVIAR